MTTLRCSTRLEPGHLAWFVLEVGTEIIDITPFTDAQRRIGA